MALDDEAQARAWIDNRQTWERATEILVPVKERVGPTWWYGKGGGWYAGLVTNPNPVGDLLMSCDHLHASEAEAWECATSLSRAFARAVLDSGDPEARP